ncbi:unnamed protein product [Albugo candida]|uniref:Palmitoyltransferase n=1 Tax=Albugo candida TaxID=65357 RepID=A0A024GCN4_9STRA|nr:unnamed protein product [Albugo candida]|eukprot:CCI44421.1 unnamed protein product [Albugo candida]
MDSRFENARIQQIYGIVALGIVLSVYHCTSIDPADNSILRPSQMSTPQPTNENQVYCNVCMHYVQDGSRHCRLCDKCIQVFDHHCKWLNNCIGQKNYFSFSIAILGTSFILSIQLSLSIYVLYKAFAEPQLIQRRAFRHLTTYDYIVRKRKLKLAREREISKARWRWCGNVGPFRKRTADTKIDKSGDAGMAHYSDVSASQKIDEELIEAEVDDELEVISTRSSENRFESSIRTNASSQVVSPQNNIATASLDNPAVSRRGFGRLMGANSIFFSNKCSVETPQQQAGDSETEYVTGLDTPNTCTGIPDDRDSAKQ